MRDALLSCWVVLDCCHGKKRRLEAKVTAAIGIPERSRGGEKTRGEAAG
jgi:hypothetical protein